MGISRYKELIKLDKNNSLSDDLFLELISYHATIESQIYYNRKQEYFLLIKKYCNQQIDSYEFRSLFLIMQKENSAFASTIYNDLEALETFQLASDRLKFSDLITEISILCSDFNQIYDETEYDIAKSEIKFFSLVKKHYSKLQKLFPVSSNKNLDYEKLIFRSFKILKWIVGSEILLILLYIFIGN